MEDGLNRLLEVQEEWRELVEDPEKSRDIVMAAKNLKEY